MVGLLTERHQHTHDRVFLQAAADENIFVVVVIVVVSRDGAVMRLTDVFKRYLQQMTRRKADSR